MDARRAMNGASFWAALTLAALGAGIPEAARACGPETDCAIGDRAYRVVLPDPKRRMGDDRPGALVFAHGYRGTADGVIRNRALTGLADELGVVFAVAQSDGPEWHLPNAPSDDTEDDVDEIAYFAALARDLEARFDVEPKKIVVTGFSSGAMMVWHLACYSGNGFAGFVPISGTFWAPVPERCPTSSINLIHYHGNADTVVPLAGRPIKDAHQGDVTIAIDRIVAQGGFVPAPPEAGSEPAAALSCASYANDDDKILELCLFPGGHHLEPAHIARAWQRFFAKAADADG